MTTLQSKTSLLAAAVVLGVGLPSSAAVWNLSGTMDPAQATTNPGNAGSGSGTISGTYDDVTNQIDYEVTWESLTSPVTVAHFHVGAPGVPGGVTLGFTPSSPSTGNATLNEAQENELLAGNWYANIHTQNFAAGEIRGQVAATLVPEPSSLALLGLGGLLIARRRR